MEEQENCFEEASKPQIHVEAMESSNKFRICLGAT